METPTSRSGPRWLRRAAFGTAACGLLVLVYLGGARVLERWRTLGVFEPHEIRTPDRAEKTVAEPSPRSISPPPPARTIPVEPAAEVPAAEPATPTPMPTLEPEAAIREPAQPDLTGMRNGILAGRTVDESGAPVPFAELRVWRAFGAQRSIDWDRPARTTSSDAEGYFALDELARPGSDSSWFLVAAESATHRSVHAITGSLEADDIATGTTIRMHERWDLPGEVFVPNGATAAQLEIMAKSENLLAPHPLGRTGHDNVRTESLPRIRSKTDSSGRFLLPLTPEKWLITIRHPSYPAHIEWVWDEPFIDVWFEVGLTFVGRITDSEGEPIAGARVYYWNSDEDRGPATTDANGEYALDGIYRGDPGSLAFVGPTHTPKVLSVSTDSDNDVVRHDGVLHPQRRVDGVVLDVNGVPAAGRSVHLLTNHLERMRMGLDTLVQTDATGRFSFDRLPDEALEIVVLQEGTSYPDARVVAKPKMNEVVLRIHRDRSR